MSSGRVRVYFGFPGGGYGRRYFDIATKPGYSQAAFHTDRGAIFVAVDHLGVGDSSSPDPFTLTYENLAEANHQASAAVLDGLRAGTLLDGVGPVDIAQTVAMGQSMGGCLLTVQQARHSTFDAVAFLGWSGVFTNFPGPDGTRIIYEMPPRGFDVRALAEQLSANSPDLDHYRFCFHWPDEDPDLMETDLASYKPYTGLVRGGRGDTVGERQRAAVCHHHDDARFGGPRGGGHHGAGACGHGGGRRCRRSQRGAFRLHIE